MPLNADEYRAYADECRQQAGLSGEPKNKERWLKLAAEWMKMAAEPEGQRERRGFNGSNRSGEPSATAQQ